MKIWLSTPSSKSPICICTLASTRRKISKLRLSKKYTSFVKLMKATKVVTSSTEITKSFRKIERDQNRFSKTDTKVKAVIK